MQSEEALVQLYNTQGILHISLHSRSGAGLAGMQPVSDTVFNELKTRFSVLVSQPTEHSPEPTLQFDQIIQSADEFELTVHHSDEALDFDDDKNL